MVDMDPAFKRRLYARLSEDGVSLKEWFIARATDYLDRDSAEQLQLNGLTSTAEGRPERSSGR